ncbi:MAG: hypothetical protein J1F66_02525 [Clostridiales bacterium]|nr:hypothetical protein [Clostridiales bacterium]
MACKIIVNRDSGNCERLDLDGLICMLGCEDAQIEYITKDTDWSAEGYDTVIVCGGDGTLHNAIDKCRNQQIIYAPCGTLNEASATSQTLTTVGKVNGESFSYVCACGSFTEIGYSAKNNRKKRWKSIAYLPQILKQYKCHEIAATLEIDGKVLEENTYTLLMVIKSHRCFGFNFNPSYKKNKKLYLLAIKSVGKDSIKNRAKMFFPFFRVFFCGISHPMSRKCWFLLPFDRLKMTLKDQQDFCMDGEKRQLCDALEISETALEKEVLIIKPPLFRHRKAKQDTKTDGRKL